MIDKFLNELTSVQSTKLFLNQYLDDCPIDDLIGHNLRLENLRRYLDYLLEHRPRLMIVGESAGFNGAKRNGLHLLTHTYFQSQIPGLGAANYQLQESNTAKTLDKIFQNDQVPLAFNIVPFFTHPDGDWTANRTPSKIEIQQYSIFAQMLFDIFRPDLVVAMGRLAESGLNHRGIPNQYVRHPSMGGHKIFINLMKTL